jgi:tetratricopeptide (TPR) repeat protein
MAKQSPLVYIAYAVPISELLAQALYTALDEHNIPAVLYLPQQDDTYPLKQIDVQIAASTHLVPILSPCALSNLAETDNPLRHEIEQAHQAQRMIVPLLVDGASLDEAARSLALLKDYETLELVRSEVEAGSAALVERIRQGPTRESAEESAFAQQMQIRLAERPVPPKDAILAEGHLDRGTLHHHQGDWGTAIAAYTLAINQYPAYLHAYNQRGVAYLAMGNTAKAAADFTRVIELVPEDPRSYFNRGMAHSTALNVEAAEADFDEAIRRKPDYASAYLSRGNMRYQRGEVAGAIEDFGRTIALEPGNVEAYGNRGHARRDSGELEGALGDFSQVLELFPHPRAYYDRGLTYHHMGDLEQADADLNEALRREPGFAHAYLARGDVRLQNGDLFDAIQDYGAAIRLDSKFVDALEHRANAYLKLGKVNNALKDFNKALRLAPENAGLYLQRGIARMIARSFAGAIADFERVIQHNPHILEAYEWRGQAHFLLGDYGLARDDFQTAARRGRGRTVAIAGGALALFRLGEKDEAFRLWRELLKRDARFGDADFTQTQLPWPPALVDTARELIAALQDSE